MAYIENNIQFNSFDSTLIGVGKKVGNKDYLGATVNDLSDIASDNGGKLPTTINALEIDWNDAQWPSTTPSAPTTINTTADLLKAIKYASVQQKTVTESAGIHGTFCTKPRLEHSKRRSA